MLHSSLRPPQQGTPRLRHFGERRPDRVRALDDLAMPRAQWPRAPRNERRNINVADRQRQGAMTESERENLFGATRFAAG